jgi:hypothetical protein
MLRTAKPVTAILSSFKKVLIPTGGEAEPKLKKLFKSQNFFLISDIMINIY